MVDEHTLLTIRNIERLLTPSTPSRPADSAHCSRPRGTRTAGAVVLLYHDVGKCRDDNHVVEACAWPSRCSTASSFRVRQGHGPTS
jgi:UTP:GlnB (protein PII) uridylyltransferase